MLEIDGNIRYHFWKSKPKTNLSQTQTHPQKHDIK
jgi:hypothetical protein